MGVVLYILSCLDIIQCMFETRRTEERRGNVDITLVTITLVTSSGDIWTSGITDNWGVPPSEEKREEPVELNPPWSTEVSNYSSID